MSFDVATAQDFPGEKYELITLFDCLHDLGDPGGALRRAEQTLADDGTCMVVEPNASGKISENINLMGRAFTASSVIVCLPAALAQEGPMRWGTTRARRQCGRSPRRPDCTPGTRRRGNGQPRVCDQALNRREATTPPSSLVSAPRPRTPGLCVW